MALAHAYTQTHEHTDTQTNSYTYIYMYMSLSVCLCVRVSVCMRVRVPFTYTLTHLHTFPMHTYTNLYAHTYSDYIHIYSIHVLVHNSHRRPTNASLGAIAVRFVPPLAGGKNRHPSSCRVFGGIAPAAIQCAPLFVPGGGGVECIGMLECICMRQV